MTPRVYKYLRCLVITKHRVDADPRIVFKRGWLWAHRVREICDLNNGYRLSVSSKCLETGLSKYFRTRNAYKSAGSITNQRPVVPRWVFHYLHEQGYADPEAAERPRGAAWLSGGLQGMAGGAAADTWRTGKEETGKPLCDCRTGMGGGQSHVGYHRCCGAGPSDGRIV